MTFRYSIEFDDGIIVTRLSGVADFPGMVRYWQDIVALADETGCRNLLGLDATDRPTALADALSLDKVFEAANVPQGFRIAWLNRNRAALPMIELLQEYIRNRRLADAQYFETESEARDWLVAQH